ncbi:MAG: hypothetical protein AB1894_12510 [Chloroflexota bacterium]
MTLRKYTLIPILLGTALLAGLLLLWPANPASAQCGSQASSCKNCHEVQAQDPVNNDSNGWHTGHAFGDFCYICHAGNNQSMDKDEAHAGMVPPLSDVKAACQQCHPNDLMERAQVYATALGQEIGTGSGTTTTGGTTTGDTTSSTTTSSAPSGGAVVVDSADVIDYNQRYEMTVTGKRPVNWGDVIVGLMIFAVAGGGGAFVYYNERKLRGLPFLPSLPASTQPAAAELPVPHIEGYEPEVLALLPRLARLDPVGLHAMQRLLENPEEASELLHSLSRLDPELVKRIRSLDRESRAMLLALAGN